MCWFMDSGGLGSRLLSVENSYFPYFSASLLFSMKFGTELKNDQYESFR